MFSREAEGASWLLNPTCQAMPAGPQLAICIQPALQAESLLLSRSLPRSVLHDNTHPTPSALQAKGPLTEQEAAQVIHDVLSVLSECHRQHIIYADVKPANFLLKHVYPDARSLVDPSIESRVIEVSTALKASAVVLPEPRCCPSGP